MLKVPWHDVYNKFHVDKASCSISQFAILGELDRLFGFSLWQLASQTLAQFFPGRERRRAMKYTAIIASAIGVLVLPTAEAMESKFTIAKRGCQRLIQHNAHYDVEFKPGVDIRGKKVKSPDLYKDHYLMLPNEYSFKFNIDIAKKYDLGERCIFAEMPVGIMKVQGRNIYFNEQKLNSSGRLAVSAECQKNFGVR